MRIWLDRLGVTGYKKDNEIISDLIRRLKKRIKANYKWVAKYSEFFDMKSYWAGYHISYLVKARGKGYKPGDRNN
jgi:hypothetical protein